MFTVWEKREIMGEFLINFAEQVLDIFQDAAVFVLFGFIVAGLLHVFIPTKMMRRFLGTGRFGPVIRASIIGLPLPLCSCGVLPAAIGLRRQGASKGATVSFLISTPETSVDSIAISFALLDPIMAIFRPVAAFITALVSGVACDRIVSGEEEERKEEVESHACCEIHGKQGEGTLRARLTHGARFAFVEMMEDLGKWLLIGIAIAAVISAAVPKDTLEHIPGGRPVAMLAMLVVGVPLYMCSTSSTPLAASLILAGVSPGAVLVLLLAGPATNSAGIIMIARELGKKAAAVYLSSVAVVSILMGVLLDVVYDHIVGTPAKALIGTASEALPEWLRIGGAVVLAGLLVRTLAVKLLKR